MVGYGAISVLFITNTIMPTMSLLFLLIGLRMLEGVFNGFFWPVLQASVSDVSANACNTVQDYEAITRSGMRVYNAGWNGGVLAGQLVLSTFVALGLLEVCLVIPLFFTLFNVLLVFFFFGRHRDHVGNKGTNVLTRNEGHELSNNGRTTRYVILVILGLVFIFIYGILLGATNTTIVNYYTFIGIPMAVGITEAARLTFQAIATAKVKIVDAVVAKTVAAIAAISCFVLTMSFITGILAPLAIFIIFTAIGALAGFFYGIVYSESINMIATNSSGTRRGLVMGFFESSIGIGFFIGPLLAGYLTEVFPFNVSFVVAATIGILGAFACILAWAVTSRKAVKH